MLCVAMTFFDARCNDEFPSIGMKSERDGIDPKIEISKRLFNSNADAEIAVDSSFIFQPERHGVVPMLVCNSNEERYLIGRVAGRMMLCSGPVFLGKDGHRPANNADQCCPLYQSYIDSALRIPGY